MIDLYCERLGPGLLAEPLNAVTNLSFIVAATVIILQASNRKILSPVIWLLAGLAFSIGLGSGLFHTFATLWAQLLDVLPILLFQVVFIWIYSRQLIMLSAVKTGVFVLLFILAALSSRQAAHLLNGSLMYAPAFMVLIILGIYHYRHAENEPSTLLLAAAVFSVSLFFRTVDMAVCDSLPIGTHFLWHLFNGLLVYLAIRALMLNVSYGPSGREKNGC